MMSWHHTLLFHSLSPFLQLCANKEQVCVCLVSAMPCPAHIATFYLRESHHHCHHQTLYCGLNRSGLQLGGNLRMPYQECKVDGVTMFKHLWWWLPESSNLCVALHYHAEAQFLLDSCEVELVWNSPEFCQPNFSHHHIHKNYSFTIPWDSDHDLPHSQTLYESFLPGRLRMVPLHRLPFFLQFKMIIPGFIRSNNRE